MSNTEFDSIGFDLPKNISNVIKVIGVGGGGSNAINHMFQAGIKGVDFVICNTDSQALENSAVPNKIQLGVSLTEGLGAGANPDVGEHAAIESEEDIKTMLGVSTKMVFITAGMGGGTGTGAAPVIAKHAKEMDILTVGIVTIPFQFEGKMRNEQAQAGIERLRANVDSLIVINNNKLREVYGNLGFKAGFSKADEVLATAAKGIAEVITHHYTQNIDLRDAKTVLSNSGTAIMGSSISAGASRAQEAIMKALDSPLLNDNKIAGAKNVLLLIVSGAEEITIDEIGEINDHIQAEAGHGANIIMGVGEDEALGDAIAVTVIATGFNVEQQDDIVNTESKKIIHTLEDEQRAERNLLGEEAQIPSAPSEPAAPIIKHELEEEEEVIPAPPVVKHVLEFDDFEEVAPKAKASNAEIPSSENDMDLIPTSSYIKNFNVFYEEVVPEAPEEEFVIVDAQDQINAFEVVAPEVVAPEAVEEDQFALSFDMPFQGQEESDVEEESTAATVTFTLEDQEEINNIEVKDSVEVVPVVEYNQEGEKRYSLDDYMDFENQMTTAQKQPKKAVEKAPAPDAGFEKRVVEKPQPVNNETVEEVDPMDSPIEQLLRERADERRKKLKDFNYKFHNNVNRVDEIEKEPAYKRLGIDLVQTSPRDQQVSRTTLGEDSNDEMQLRTNNSFLHDNVD